MTTEQPSFLDHYAKEIGLLVRPPSPATTEPLEQKPTTPYHVDLHALRTQALVCDACELCQNRTQVVFGTGNPQANFMIIGEAPGQDEDRLGQPFVGRAGQLLNQMLRAIQYPREQVYISNIILCRPPNNRNPNEDEAEACRYWLESQWQAIQPKVVCLLGKVAMQHVLGKTSTLSAARGQWFEHLNSQVMVSYHPAYLLRSPAQKKLAWQDMHMLMRELKKHS